MKLETPIIAIVLGGLFFILMFSSFIDISSNYEGSNVKYPLNTNTSAFSVNEGTESLQGTLNKINKTKADAEEIEQEFRNLQPNPTALLTFGHIGYKIGILIFDGILLISDTITSVSQIFGIDAFIGSSLFLILFLIILISIIMLLLGRTYG